MTADRMSAETREKLLLALCGSLLTLLVTVVGVVLGNHLSQQNAERTFSVQRQRDLQERSYTKLAGLRVIWGQMLLTHFEAKMLSDYYYARFQVVSHNADDLAESKRQYERGLNLLPTISSLQREVLEALADATVAYSLDEDGLRKVEAVYNVPVREITPVDRSTIRTEADLMRWKEETWRETEQYIREAYTGRIEAVLPILLAQLKEGR